MPSHVVILHDDLVNYQHDQFFIEIDRLALSLDLRPCRLWWRAVMTASRQYQSFWKDISNVASVVLSTCRLPPIPTITIEMAMPLELFPIRCAHLIDKEMWW